MKVAHGRDDFVAARAALRGAVGAVFTMGALHDGHQALLQAARQANDSLLATIFLNPTQFGPNEDLARYPRTLEQDLARCEKAGADLVWTPDVDDVYPAGDPQVRVEPGPLGSQLEGAVRPGHFAGVLTVVAKLLHLSRPDRAYFGQKDYQQLVLIRRMVADLDFRAGLGTGDPTEIVGVATVRETDGLALSSRNAYLDGPHRRSAVALSAALQAAGRAAGAGPDAAVAAGRAVLDAAGIDPDYLELRDPELGPAPAHGQARLLVAARVGATRLIDNALLEIGVELG